MAEEEKAREERIEEYRAAVTGAAMCGQILQQFDIPKLLEDIERAAQLGVFFDPTLWIKKSSAMEQDRELLRAALPLFLHVRKALKDAGERRAKGAGGE